jgi:hypothetical protein
VLVILVLPSRAESIARGYAASCTYRVLVALVAFLACLHCVCPLALQV